MVNHHPDLQFLTDYAAGSLSPAQALCVATHLHYCATCKLKLRDLTMLGAELFLQQDPLAVASTGFDRLLERVENMPLPVAEENVATNQVIQQAGLPKPLHKLAHGRLDSLKWRKIGRTFRYSTLRVDPQRVTTLVQIKAGCSVPHHRHTGDEITVVINGSFSDDKDQYGSGDFIVRTSGEHHRPIASQDGDCLCLITLDAPIVMSNWFYRVVQQILKT